MKKSFRETRLGLLPALQAGRTNWAILSNWHALLLRSRTYYCRSFPSARNEGSVRVRASASDEKWAREVHLRKSHMLATVVVRTTGGIVFGVPRGLTAA